MPKGNTIQDVVKNGGKAVKMKDGSEKRLTVWSVPEMDLEEIAIDKKEKKKAAFEQ